MTSDAEPLRPGAGDPERIDPDELPLARLGRSDDDEDDQNDEPAERTMRTWWFVTAAAVIVVVGMVIGIVVFNASAPKSARGAATARAAASEYVASINAGDLVGAAAVACRTFIDEARSAARSGKDAGIGFTLGAVESVGKTHATAVVTEHLKLPGSSQTHSVKLSVLRSSGRWLVCGQAS